MLLNGARQTGKSTLVQSGEIVGSGDLGEARYLTLDDARVLAAEGGPGWLLRASPSLQ